jgi:pyruvate carboxylase
MQRALHELRIIGVETSIPFHRAVLAETDFRRGDVDIRYLEKHPEVLTVGADEESLRAAAVAAALLEEQRRQRESVARIAVAAPGGSGWRDQGWRS